MWNIFKVNNKDTRTTPLVWTYFTPYSSVSIVTFEKVNTDRVVQDLLSNPSLQKLKDTFNSFILRINTKKQMWCFARFCTICTLKKTPMVLLLVKLQASISDYMHGFSGQCVILQKIIWGSEAAAGGVL